MLSHYDAIKKVRTNLDDQIEELVIRLGYANTTVMRDSLTYDLEMMQEEYVSLTNDLLVLAHEAREGECLYVY